MLHKIHHNQKRSNTTSKQRPHALYVGCSPVFNRSQAKSIQRSSLTLEYATSATPLGLYRSYQLVETNRQKQSIQSPSLFSSSTNNVVFRTHNHAKPPRGSSSNNTYRLRGGAYCMRLIKSQRDFASVKQATEVISSDRSNLDRHGRRA